MPGEVVGRALIIAACLLALAGIWATGCRSGDDHAAMASCRSMCAPLAVSAWFAHRFDGAGNDAGPVCVCADAPVATGAAL